MKHLTAAFAAAATAAASPAIAHEAAAVHYHGADWLAVVALCSGAFVLGWVLRAARLRAGAASGAGPRK